MVNESEALKAVAKSNTEFASSLYHALALVETGNLISSPYGLSALMAMIKGGAVGQTANDIVTVMKFPTNDDTLFQGYKALINSLKSDGKNFTLETVSRIYAKTGFQLEKLYEDAVIAYFDAKIQQLDFEKSAETANIINNFVDEFTHGKIKDLVSSIDFDSTTRLFLLNAIYFKGLWKYPFDKTLTEEADFYLNKKDFVKVPMMNNVKNFHYAEIEDLNATAISLPYKGDGLSMIILLPNDIEGLQDLETRLQNFSLADIPGRLRERKINLSMPKFTLESTIDLKIPLTSLGAGSLFDSQKADFSGIPVDKSQGFHVSKVIQKAFIEVNEDGTEAAAATYIMPGCSRSKPIVITDMEINHSFVFIITMALKLEGNGRESETVPLFFGKCTKVDVQKTSKRKRSDSSDSEN